MLLFPPAVNGNWSEWAEWSECSVTCSVGTITRTRTCDNPPPSNGGLPCPGPGSEDMPCRMPACYCGNRDMGTTGAIIASVQGHTAESCQDHCRATGGCASWTWSYLVPTQDCAVKSADYEASKTAPGGSISGPMNCPEP